jgi:hypothetical protein
MNKEQIIDEVYKNYLNEWTFEKYPNDGSVYSVEPIKVKEHSKEQFVYRCKTDSKFSETWGLKIEERELSLEERSIIAKSNHYEVSQNIKMFVRVDEDHSLHKHLDDINIPTKLITLTNKNETIEIYE